MRAAASSSAAHTCPLGRRTASSRTLCHALLETHVPPVAHTVPVGRVFEKPDAGTICRNPRTDGVRRENTITALATTANKSRVFRQKKLHSSIRISPLRETASAYHLEPGDPFTRRRVEDGFLVTTTSVLHGRFPGWRGGKSGFNLTKCFIFTSIPNGTGFQSPLRRRATLAREQKKCALLFRF